MPLPNMTFTLCFLSSSLGGFASKYRAVSPTYTNAVELDSRISDQNLEVENFLPSFDPIYSLYTGNEIRTLQIDMKEVHRHYLPHQNVFTAEQHVLITTKTKRCLCIDYVTVQISN